MRKRGKRHPPPRPARHSFLISLPAWRVVQSESLKYPLKASRIREIVPSIAC